MLIDANSDEYKKLFGHRDFTREFTSRLPPREAMLACMVDPSNCTDAISSITGTNVLYSAGVEDFQWGVQHMVHALAVKLAGSTPGASTGMLRHLQAPLALVMQNVKIANAIAELDVEKLLLDAGFGAGMKGLSALGPVGKVIAAVVGLGKMIYDIVRTRQQIKAENAKERERLAFERMPPLQQVSEETDTYYVNTVVLPLMQGGHWTPLFAPRFSPTSEWVGLERNGGFAFAPGTTLQREDEFGRATQVFKASGGVGLIPGFDEITSVIQVALPYDHPSIQLWRNDPTRNWPIKPQYVTDVGRYYVNTGRLASVAWSWATEQDATPNLYKIFVGKPNGPGSQHLHYQWSNYCAGALRYLNEKTGVWKHLTDKNLEYVYGSGISCSMATWQCKLEGGTTYHPIYSRISPGLPRDEMNIARSLKRQGCVMDTGYLRGAAGGRACLVSLYDSHIRETLEAVRRRQVHFLRHSLVCAYVREAWDAFLDDELRELLRSLRSTLLRHPDRHLVELDDVPEDEPFNGGDWKTQLIKAGVKSKPPVPLGLDRAALPGKIEPIDVLPPKVPPNDKPMPFGELATSPRPRRPGDGDAQGDGTSSRRTRLLGLASALGTAGIGAYAFYRYRRQ